MRNGKLRGLLITVMLLVFLAGLASILYPYIWGAAVDSSIASTAKDFLEREEPELSSTAVIIDSIEPEKVKPYPELWEDMARYNQSIAAQGQSGLSCAYDYQKASFRLADYGLPDEIFGVLSIPAIDLEMPIYLGATEQHMADGAAHLSQTSLPIGGMDTNCVIAGHRGYSGASYFRYLDKLHAYDLRGSDYDPGLPVTIQEYVVVNHAATVITATPIDLTDAGYPQKRQLRTLLSLRQTAKKPHYRKNRTIWFWMTAC